MQKTHRFLISLTMAMVALLAIAEFEIGWAQDMTSNFRPYRLLYTQATEVGPQLRSRLAELNTPAEVLVDQSGNRVLVAAPEQSQRLVSDVIAALDRPAAPAQAPAVARAYPVAAADLQTAMANLQRQFPPSSGVRIASDQRTGQLIVLAPEATHQQIATLLAGTATNPAPQVAPARPSPHGDSRQFTAQAPYGIQAQFAAQGQLAGQGYLLENISWRDLENKLSQIWGDRLSVVTQNNGGVSLVSTSGPSGRQPALQIDRHRNSVVFLGPPSVSSLWEQVVKALDQAPNQTENQSGVVAIRNADPEKIRRAVKLVQAVSQSGKNGAPVLATQPPAESQADVVAMAVQPAGQANGATATGPAAVPQAGAAENRTESGGSEQNGQQATGLEGIAAAADDGGLIGPVQIEFMEGLDAIMIRGHKRDVERVRRIIADIEDISEKTQPKIEVVRMKFIGSQVAVELIAEIYDEIFSSRQGQVSMRPLVKPNAILLIGRPESVELVQTLITKLDTPVRPESQFEVFPLKHISALDAQETIEAFFVDKLGEAQQGGAGQQGTGSLRPGLGTRVNVVAEYRSNSLIVQASPRDMEEVRSLIAKIDVESTPATNELRIFRLKNALATDIAPVLQDALNWQLIGNRAPLGATGNGSFGFGGQGFGQTEERARIRSAILKFMTVDAKGGKVWESGLLADVRVTADTNSNSLVVTAPSKSMGMIEALIKELDNLPAAKAQIKVFTIINGDATALAGMLQQLLSQQATTNQQFGGTTTFGTGSLNPFLQPSLQSAAASGESTLVPIRFGVDQRTNSIIASGTEGDLGVIEALLVRLDEEVTKQHKTTVYWLANSSAADVAEAVNAWLDERTSIFADQLQISPESPEIQFERQVIIVPEELSNSVIISAVPELFDEVKRVVESLDRRPPMVKIDVLIAEVSLTNDFEFGVEWGLQDAMLFRRSDSPGFNFNNSALGTRSGNPADDNTVLGQGLTSFNLSRVSPTTGYGGLVLGASSDAVSALLRALQQDRRAQILSRPQIMTLDGQGANVNVGQTVSRVQGSSANQNAVTQDIVDTPTGITLGVTPRVTPDGLIVMEVDVIKSALSDTTFTEIPNSGGGTPILQAAIDNASAQTTVAARSGQTVVFAGLIKTTHFNETRGIPLLSQVPVAGRLFRYDRESYERSELLIILTPHIVTGEEELDWIKLSETERMSWCLSDVYDLWGADSLQSNGACPSECPTVYPMSDPLGIDPTAPSQDEEVVAPTTTITDVQSTVAPNRGVPRQTGHQPTPGAMPGMQPIRAAQAASGVQPVGAIRSQTPPAVAPADNYRR